MKKSVMLVFVSLIFLLLVSTSFVLAQNNSTEQEKVNKAYQCLEDKVSDVDCDSLTTEEKIFTVLATGQCRSELIDDSENSGECWPEGDCDVKTTAQAIIALKNTGSNTEDAKDWLLERQSVPSDVEWYLEIDSAEETTCTISYVGSSGFYNVGINEDKKLTNNAGSCLILAQDDYWLRISPSCFEEEFEISCDESFLTTLLFKETGSSTIQVLEETSSASASGSTFENVESFCFSDSGSGTCNYEGSLWATVALDILDEEVSTFIPYLVTKADSNPRLIPESFLYFLIGNTDYRTETLSGQKSGKWWLTSGNRYYDTAVALYPFQSEASGPQEKTNSKNWLLDVQDEEGCWNSGNVRDTAFILASIWPRNSGSSDGSGTGGISDCEDAGNYCMPSSSCTSSGGQILGEYSCSSTFSRCCNVAQQLQTCSELGGEICSTGEICKSGRSRSASDTRSGEACCVNGFCEAQTQQSLTDCELNLGECRQTSCLNGEEEAGYSCSGTGGVCCVSESSSGSGSLWWVWTLLVLITLTVIGIIFRDKLRMLWLKTKSGFGGKGSKHSAPGRPGPRPPPRHLPMRTPERRILFPAEPQRPSPKPPLKPSRSQKELDDVLKKLKDMSK